MIGGGTRGRSLGAVDDAGLVGLARRGSQLAGDEIVQRFGGLIATIARHHRLSEADAADVAQATWVQLFRHLGDYLLVWEGRPYHDVAATLGMAIGSIGPTRQRTLRRLARHPDIAGLVLDGQPAA